MEDEGKEERESIHADEVRSLNEHDPNEAEHEDERLLEDREGGREKDERSQADGRDEDYCPEDDGGVEGWRMMKTMMVGWLQ